MSVSTSPRLLVTGATGQLGSLVIEALLKTTPAAEIAGNGSQGRRGPSSESGALERNRAPRHAAPTTTIPLR